METFLPLFGKMQYTKQFHDGIQLIHIDCFNRDLNSMTHTTPFAIWLSQNPVITVLTIFAIRCFITYGHSGALSKSSPERDHSRRCYFIHHIIYHFSALSHIALSKSNESIFVISIARFRRKSRNGSSIIRETRKERNVMTRLL